MLPRRRSVPLNAAQVQRRSRTLVCFTGASSGTPTGGEMSQNTTRKVLMHKENHMRAAVLEGPPVQRGHGTSEMT